MSSFLAPAVWLVLGLFAILSWRRISSPSYLANRSQDHVAALGRTFRSRLYLLFSGAIALSALLATARSVWQGAPTWWL